MVAIIYLLEKDLDHMDRGNGPNVTTGRILMKNCHSDYLGHNDRLMVGFIQFTGNGEMPNWVE